MVRWTTMVVLGAAVLSLLGCGEADCSLRCAEAQQEQCLWVEGDCQAFCDALEPLAEAAGCVGAADDYQQCLVDADACDIDAACGPAEAVYFECVAEFCAVQPTDAECMTLERSR